MAANGRLPRVGIMGAGAIGCYVGGRLLAGGRAEVTLVGRPSLAESIASHGLTVQEVDWSHHADASQVRFETDIGALTSCDVVFIAVKSGATVETARALADVLAPGAVVVSLQNGVRNPALLREHLPGHRVVPAVVDFNVVMKDGAVFQQSTSGPLVFETREDSDDAGWLGALRAGGFTVKLVDPIAPDQWTKLLVNLNNSISALSDAPVPTMILTPGYRRAMTMLLDEALDVLDAAGIRIAKFRGVPMRVMAFILKLPTPIVRVVVRAQLRVDPESRASMWQDLEKRRPTEVEFLNGEIVRLAEAHGRDAPINRRIVELVHEAERKGQGSPRMSPESLLQALR